MAELIIANPCSKGKPLTIMVFVSASNGNTFKVISLNITRVPNDPVINFDKSYPVTFFTTVPPDLTFSPFPLNPLKPKIWSLALPTLNLRDPEKLQDKVPPIVPSLESVLNILEKFIGSKAKCWLFFFSTSWISFMGVPALTVIYNSSGL